MNGSFPRALLRAVFKHALRVSMQVLETQLTGAAVQPSVSFPKSVVLITHWLFNSKALLFEELSRAY